MGHRHIFAINEDAIALNRDRDEDLASAIGKAVVSLCHEPPVMNMSGPKPALVNDRAILNHGAAVQHAGKVDYNESCVFAFSRASLKPLDQLSTEEFQEIEALVAAESARRGI